MEVRMGNPSPVKVLEERTSPTVFYCSVPPILTYVVAESGAEMRIGRDASGKSHVREIKSAAALAEAVAGHIGRSVDGITHLPDQEALLAVIASWRAESAGTPLWVWSDNEDFAVLLGEFFNAPVGRPDNVEDTHYSDAGPPGVGPRDAEADARVAVANEPTKGS
jgi:hypothetical protein